MKYLYLDDIREPKTNKDWVVVRTYDEALEYIKQNGCPDYISFDHDLGENVPSGYDVAKWIVNMDIEMNGMLIPENFEFNVHSANPIGKSNIEGILTNYLEFRKK